MKKTTYHIILFAITTLYLWSCDNKEYLYRDTSPRIWLSSETITNSNVTNSTDSTRFSFRLLNDDVTEGTAYFMAYLTGQAAGYDREFKLEVVEDGTNISSSYYRIDPTVMPSGQFEARIPVYLQRHIPGMDLTDWQNNITARVKFRVMPNETFLQGAEGGRQFLEFTVVWCDFLTKPATYSYQIEVYIGPFSQRRYKFYIDFTGKTEFDEYDVNVTTRSALQAALRKALQEYNDQADRNSEEHYKDDDGSDLHFNY